MPKELLRFSSHVQWLNATVFNWSYGMETALRFEVDGKPFSIAFNSLPDSAFFRTLQNIRCVSIQEFSSAERGWVEPGRYQIRLNDDDDYDMERVLSDYVRWGPT